MKNDEKERKKQWNMMKKRDTNNETSWNDRKTMKNDEQERNKQCNIGKQNKDTWWNIGKNNERWWKIEKQQ